MPPRILIEVSDKITTSLPMAAGIVSEVINTIHDSSSSARDLAEIIENDPSISAKVINVANSALYGSSTTINSVKRAIVIIGFESIKELVLNTVLLHYFFDPELRSEVDRPGLWLHSVGTAHASKLIAERANMQRPDVAYTAGLLHDIGKVLLSNFFFKRYGKIVQLAAEKNCRIILAERSVLKADHTAVGKVLCDAWALPEDITAAILSHHDPMEATAENRKLTSIVHLGDIMCRMTDIGNPGDTAIPEISRAALGILGSTPDIIDNNFDAVLADLEELKPQIEDFFGQLDTGDKEQEDLPSTKSHKSNERPEALKNAISQQQQNPLSGNGKTL